MSETIEIKLPDFMADHLRTVASENNQTIADVVLSHLRDRILNELPIETLPDDEVLALADLQMDSEEGEEFEDLLYQQREREITEAGKLRLAQLMNIYEQGMLRKAEAIKVAVERGLRPPMHP